MRITFQLHDIRVSNYIGIFIFVLEPLKWKIDGQKRAFLWAKKVKCINDLKFALLLSMSNMIETF